MQIELDEDLVALLEGLAQPASEKAREPIVLGLYRQGELSSGKAAQLLSMQRADFIRYASTLGIPYFQLSGGELRRELDASKARLRTLFGMCPAWYALRPSPRWA